MSLSKLGNRRPLKQLLLQRRKLERFECLGKRTCHRVTEIKFSVMSRRTFCFHNVQIGIFYNNLKI